MKRPAKRKTQSRISRTRTHGFQEVPQSIFLSILVLIVLIAYSNTIHSTWHFDDYQNIVANPAVHLKTLSWKGVQSALMTRPGGMRAVAYLSFALNYYISGLNVFSYHLVNLLVHLCNAWLVFFIVVQLAQSMHPEAPLAKARVLAFFATALWAVSPLQIQAVTYIVQRIASLAAFFFLLSFLLYVKWRQGPPHWRFLAGALLSALAALGTKENTAMLPGLILVYEIYRIKDLRSWCKAKWPLLLTAVLFGTVLLGLAFQRFHVIQRLRWGYLGRDFTMTERVLTQFRVVVFHISQLLLPLPSRLALHHEFPKSHSLLSPPTTLVSLFLIAAMIAALLLAKKRWPLLSFFGVWFFLNLVIESSVIPIEMIFEHRLYLPSAGFFVVVVFPLLFWKSDLQPKTLRFSPGIAICSVAVLTSVFLTYERNRVWKDETTLWEDNRDKYPQSVRGQTNLGNIYAAEGKDDLAELALREAIRLNPNYPGAKVNLALLCLNQGRLKESLEWADSTVPGWNAVPVIYYDLGLIYDKNGQLDKAVDNYQKALERDPRYSEALFNLGLVFARLHRNEEAHSMLTRFLAGWNEDLSSPYVEKARRMLSELGQSK
jgi:tetratricopeptide (TPR) repeat protein